MTTHFSLSDAALLPWNRTAAASRSRSAPARAPGHTVDSVPWYLLPGFWLYGYGLGLLIWVFLRLLRLTCRIEYRGEKWLDAYPNYILSAWHSQIILGFIAFPHFRDYIMMNHPLAYMKPMHVFLSLIGVKRLILGSTGHNGRAAAVELTDCLRRGASTVMMPDGPRGPAHELKKGVLHISAHSGVPILPVRIETSSMWRLPGWDRKQVPRLFARIVVHIQPPVQVEPGRIDEAAAVLAQRLG